MFVKKNYSFLFFKHSKLKIGYGNVMNNGVNQTVGFKQTMKKRALFLKFSLQNTIFKSQKRQKCLLHSILTVGPHVQ